MKIEKYNLNIEREFIRVNSKNKLVESSFPKAFGNKEKNSIITADEDNIIFKIKTPMEKNANDAYDKFVEITNVITEELYKINQYIWPLGKFINKDSKIVTKAQINIAFNEEFYEEIKEKEFLPNTIEEVNEKIKEEFERKIEMLQGLYGKCKIKAGKSKIKISSINLNYLSKCGIAKEDVMFLLAFIFGCLEKDESKNLKEEIKYLYKIDKKYNLKAKEEITIIENEIKSGLCRLEKENNLTDKEIKQLLENYTDEGHNARYCLQNYKKLVSESVVLIKDAISQGVDYKVLNELKVLFNYHIKEEKNL